MVIVLYRNLQQEKSQPSLSHSRVLSAPLGVSEPSQKELTTSHEPLMLLNVAIYIYASRMHHWHALHCTVLLYVLWCTVSYYARAKISVQLLTFENPHGPGGGWQHPSEMEPTLSHEHLVLLPGAKLASGAYHQHIDINKRDSTRLIGLSQQWLDDQDDPSGNQNVAACG